MPLLIKPTNDATRLNLLTTSVNTHESDTKNGKQYLMEETAKKAANIRDLFNTGIKAETGKLGERSKEIREKNEAVNILETCIRDMWEVVKRRVYRKSEPAEVLTYYQLPLDGTVPRSIPEQELPMLAAKIIEGDQKAVAAGYPAAQCPDVQDLEQDLQKANKEKSEVAQADRQYDEAYQALAELRAHADEVIDDIIADLEYNLRKLEPASRRRIMRTYGVSFQYAKGEPEETDASAA